MKAKSFYHKGFYCKYNAEISYTTTTIHYDIRQILPRWLIRLLYKKK